MNNNKFKVNDIVYYTGPRQSWKTTYKVVKVDKQRNITRYMCQYNRGYWHFLEKDLTHDQCENQ